MDNKLIDILFHRLWNGLNRYPGDKNDSITLNIRLENMRNQYTSTQMTLNKNELLKYIEKSAKSFDVQYPLGLTL